MQFIGADKLEQFLEEVYCFQPELKGRSRGMLILIEEVGGTIRVSVIIDEDTPIQLPAEVIRAARDWARLVARFYGVNGMGITARRLQWQQRLQEDQMSHAKLADELNTQVEALFGELVTSTTEINRQREISDIIGRQIAKIKAQHLSEAELDAAYLRVARIYHDPQMEAIEQLPALCDRQRAAREELWLLLRAGGYTRPRVQSLIDGAVDRFQLGEPLLPYDDQFDEKQMIECLRREEKSEQGKEHYQEAKQRMWLMEKSA